MRYREIIAEIGDTWETRFADHQRRQAKRVKLRGKLADQQAKLADQQRAAAVKRHRGTDKLRSIRRDLADL